MQSIVVLANALAHEARIRTLLLLCEGPLCVCDLAAVLRQAPTATARHVAILRRAGLIATERKAGWDYARLTVDRPPSAATLTWVQSLADASQIQTDRERLSEMLAIPAARRCAADVVPRARRAQA